MNTNQITVTIQGQSITFNVGTKDDPTAGDFVRLNYTKGTNGKTPRKGNIGDTSPRSGYIVMTDQKNVLKVHDDDTNSFRTYSLAGISDLVRYPRGWESVE